MKSQYSFPTPVLGNGDDFRTPSPELTLLQVQVGSEVRLSVAPKPLRTGNGTIDGLVQEQAAAWTLRVHCARSYFRIEEYLTHDGDGPALSVDQVEGDVLAGLFIVATRPIEGYRPEGLHEDYGDSVFEVSQGEVLASLGEFEFQIEPRFDPLRADPPSLIQFERSRGEETGPFRVELAGDNIIVYLPEAEWLLVHAVQEETPDLLHSCLALPALADALRDLSEQDSRRWAVRLKAMIHQRGISGLGGLDQAQELLKNPLTRGLTQLRQALGNGEF